MFIVDGCQLSVVRCLLSVASADLGGQQLATGASSNRQSSILQMTPRPFVQNKKTPHARPACASLQEVCPHLPDCAAVQALGQRRRNGLKLRYYLCLERAMEPILPGQGKGPLSMGDHFTRQQVTHRLHQERFG